jgi:hypothetical protein
VVGSAGLKRKVPLSVVSWVLLEWMRQGRMLTMAKEVVQYCLMMFAALVTNHTYGIANTVDGMFTSIVVIVMMQVLIATDIGHSSLGSGFIGLDIIIDFTVFM